MAVKTTLDVALKYAERGWHVFPLHWYDSHGCSCNKKDCTSPGKHPRTKNGVHDATTDPAIIRGWWQTWPGANIGIRCGAVSGLVVIDVDPRHGGDETLLDVQEEHGKLPATIESMTGGGGRHILFAHPGGRIKTGANVFGQGLDVRADDGYIVAPPSIHSSGRRYEWEPSSLPSTTALADMPPWMIPIARDTSAGDKYTPPAALLEGDIIEGGRNQALTSLAGTMRNRGMSADAVYAALMVENNARCKPPLSADEVMQIARSVSRYEPKAPFMPQSGGAQQAQARDPMNTFAVATAFVDLLGNLEGRTLLTGIHSLDHSIGGLERQTEIVLAARPSMGKSTLAWQIARNQAEAGHKVLFFSLEMSAPALWAKAACGELGIRWLAVRMGQVSESTIQQLIEKSNDLMYRYGENLLIDDAPNTSETIWKTVEKYRPDVVVIDHLRQVSDQGDSEVRRLGTITQRLKDIAKGFNCAVLCLAQLNRQVESQDNKRPNLGDLRDSGQIEENADVVLMLYRDDYYSSEPTTNRYSNTEILVRKFRDDIRNQRTVLAFDTQRQRFEDTVTVNLNTDGIRESVYPSEPDYPEDDR